MTAPGRTVLLAVAVLSAATLAFEVLLLRLFAIVQWHHYAYMVISLALLGFGASGVILAAAGRRLVARFRASFSFAAVALGASMVGSVALAQRVPFNALELVWSPEQLVRLALVYAVLAVPFLLAGTCIGLAFMRFSNHIGAIYGADLLGAGSGSALILAALLVVRPESAIQACAVLAIGSGLMVALQGAGRAWRAAAALLLLALVAGATAGYRVDLRMSQFKDLSQALRVVGARVVAERSGPLGLVTAVANDEVPLRHAPGLSLLAGAAVPEQIALFVDGAAAGAVDREHAPAHGGYLRHVTGAAAYPALHEPSVLVLGAGGGAGVRQALAHGASSVDAVEFNRDVIELVRDDLGSAAGRIYRHEAVTVHASDARHFVGGTSRRFDLIALDLLDSFAGAAGGLHAPSESYLYTLEALDTYLDRLDDDGIVSITRWVKLPPRDGLKLFVAAVEVLERRGAAAPAAHLVWIRSWSTSTVLIKREPWREREVRAVVGFARDHAFDTIHYPGMASREANRFNRLSRPWFHEAARAVLSPGRDDFIARYRFDIRPSTDDRPYHFDYFRWSGARELLATHRQGGAALLELGYLIVLATLVQAVVAGAVLVSLPRWLRQRGSAGSRAGRMSGAGPALAYTAAIGLGFLMIEIVFIQRMVLFLGDPLYAVAAVLALFLVFAGLGSRFSNAGAAASVTAPVALIVASGLLSLALLPALPGALPLAGGVAKAVVCAALIAPIATPMGMMLPRALARLGRDRPDLLPWAWAVNGCASVVAAPLAALIAIHFGFGLVLGAALVLYLAADWLWRAFAPRVECSGCG